MHIHLCIEKEFYYAVLKKTASPLQWTGLRTEEIKDSVKPIKVIRYQKDSHYRTTTANYD